MLDTPSRESSPQTIVGTFLAQAAVLAERPFVYQFRDGVWESVSWRVMRELMINTSVALAKRIKKGDRVLLLSENRLEWMYCDLAIQAAGGVTVPIYPTSSPATISAICANCRPRLALASSAMAGLLPSSLSVIEFEKDLTAITSLEPEPNDLQLLQKRLDSLNYNSLATIVYTSGTTGEPKGVMLSNRQFIEGARAALKVFDLSPLDISLSFLPFSHILERHSEFFVGVQAGLTIYLSRIDRLASDISQVKPTVMICVPRVYEKIHAQVKARLSKESSIKRQVFKWALDCGRIHISNQASIWKGLEWFLADRLVLKSLRQKLTGGRLRFFISGGAPLALEVEEFFWSLGLPILQGWGMTETCSGATSNTPTRHRYGSCGQPLPGVEVAIAEDGEVLVKSPALMSGYYKNPEETSAVLHGSWLATGDIGQVDAEGFLFITDRKKDLLKTSGGKYVSPLAIEALLERDELILHALIIGDNRSFCTALIVPDWDLLRERLQLSAEPISTLLDDPRVRARIAICIGVVNPQLGRWEQIHNFALLAEDFSESKGELTPTLKLRRRAILERYADIISSFYEGR